VREVHEDEGGGLIAQIETLADPALRCGHCSRRTTRIHSRQPVRQWRDLSVRGQPLVLRYAPARVACVACGPRVEHIPRAAKWPRVTTALAGAIAALARQPSPQVEGKPRWQAWTKIEPVEPHPRSLGEGEKKTQNFRVGR
jgi:transposase